MAFEEQLSRNRILVKQIAELVAIPSPQPSKASKAKAALKWLVKQLNEGKVKVFFIYHYYFVLFVSENEKGQNSNVIVT